MQSNTLRSVEFAGHQENIVPVAADRHGVLPFTGTPKAAPLVQSDRTMVVAAYIEAEQFDPLDPAVIDGCDKAGVAPVRLVQEIVDVASVIPGKNRRDQTEGLAASDRRRDQPRHLIQ